jgi:ribose/xylose/arabinose/galactoside ABC-type transport system permease subunit/ABC-type multidrug transport system ATPase subunit
VTAVEPAQREATPVLSVRGLTKTFGQVVAIDNVDFDVYDNEVLGIVGDNGAGKSTFLSLLTGYNQPDSGWFLHRGKSVKVSSPAESRRRLRIEMIYQDLAMAPDLQVWQNLFIGEEETRWGGLLKPAEMKQQARDALQRMGTKIRPDDVVEHLSGGERQLVAIARALLFERDIILMDEPTAAISAAKAHDVLQTIRALHERGKTVLLVSHRLEDILEVCTRVAVFGNGRITEVADTEGLTLGRLRLERVRPWLRRVLGSEGSVRRPIAFLVIAFIIATAITPSFARLGNLNALLISSSFLIVLAVGEAFVIMVGSIDLGVESLLACGGMFVAWLTVLHGVPTAPALLLTLVAATAVGALVGLLVSKVHIPSFIVTLGTYWGMRGIALLLHNGSYISPTSVHPARPFGFAQVAEGTAGVSNLIIIAVLLVALGQCVLSFTPLGLRLKMVGSNEVAARRVGVKAAWLKASVFAVSAFLAASAGIMITAWQGSIYPLTAQGYSLEAIAAVILGGIPFRGGRGTIVGAALGALLIGIINDVIVLLGLPSLYEYIFVALVLVIAGLQARGGPLVK